MRVVFAVGVLAACGRIHFDPAGGSVAGDGGVADAPVVGRWRTVATNGESTCAITLTGELWCWGLGDSGQLGLGTQRIQPMERVDTSTTWTEIAVGGVSACGLRDGGELWCWGLNFSGVLPGVTPDIIVGPRRIGTGTWSRVFVGEIHACAIAADEALWCWGDGGRHVLGTGSNAASQPPTQIGSGRWRTISTSTESTCGVQTDNSLWCWGTSTNGEVGNGSFATATTPVRIGTNTWLSVAVAIDHACAIDSNNVVWCWGANGFGATGTTAGGQEPAPVIAGGVPPLVAIAAGRHYTCGITTAGELACWGLGDHGQLGLPVLRTDAALVASGIAQLAIGDRVTCVIDTGDRLACTGDNAFGQAGPPGGEQTMPARADSDTDWVAIAIHGWLACAAKASGSLHCWGYNPDGAVGTGDRFDRQRPFPTGSAGTAFRVGFATVSSLAADGSAWAAGRFPDGSVKTTAQQLLGPGSASRLAIGRLHGCHVAPGSTLACGGDNGAGQLGDGTTASKPSVAVGGAWLDVFLGDDSSCATEASGAPYCWGKNTLGQLGIGSTTNRTTPQLVTIGDPGMVSHVAMGAGHACARMTSGTIWCWGSGAQGQLGNNSLSSSTTPVRATMRSDWAKVVVGDLHTCALDTAGGLWCWGHGDIGQLGSGPGGNSTTAAIQVGTTSDWVDVAAGIHFSCGIRQDGTRWCWGADEWGQLGNGLAWREQLHVIP